MRGLRWLVLVALAPSMGGMLGSAASESTFRKTPYLIYAGDPSTMTILWETYGEKTCSLVLRTADGREVARQSGAEIAANVFRVDLESLAPDTQYAYDVTAGVSSCQGQFWTALTDADTHVVFYGITDTQDASLGRGTMAFVSEAIAQDARSTASPAFLLHAGDWVWEGIGFQDRWDKVFKQLAETFGMMPTVGVDGNHDFGARFTTLWPYPYAGGGVGYSWAFNFGPVHVVALDNSDLADDEVAWVVQDVEANRSRPWTILLLHDHTALGAGAGSWGEPTLYDVLAARGLDLVLCGHTHQDELFAWDPGSFQGSKHDGIGNLLPILVMANGSRVADPAGTCTPYWYRFDVSGQQMTVAATNAENKKTELTYNLTARP